MKTEILMSFAMANHGAAFANWLRDKLMKNYSYYHPEAVYVDSVVARANPAAKIRPDLRPHMRSPTGAVPIGAMLQNWNQLYKKAMSEASVMLFVLTPEYKDSIWCMKEWGQMHMENGKRRVSKRTPLRGVVLEFVSAHSLVANSENTIQKVPVTKDPAIGQALLWDKGDWCISEASLRNLVNAIGKL